MGDENAMIAAPIKPVAWKSLYLSIGHAEIRQQRSLSQVFANEQVVRSIQTSGPESQVERDEATA